MTACILLLAPLSAKAPNMDHKIHHKPAKHHTTTQQTSDQDDATYETKAKEVKSLNKQKRQTPDFNPPRKPHKKKRKRDDDEDEASASLGGIGL